MPELAEHLTDWMRAEVTAGDGCGAVHAALRRRQTMVDKASVLAAARMRPARRIEAYRE